MLKLPKISAVGPSAQAVGTGGFKFIWRQALVKPMIRVKNP